MEITLGPENFRIEGYELYVDTTRVYPGATVEVDPATTHSIRVRYQVRNDGATTFHWWECCVTIWDVTHAKAIGSRNDHAQGWLSTWKDQTISVGKIAEPTAFRVKIWANQDYGAAAPPTGSW